MERCSHKRLLPNCRQNQCISPTATGDKTAMIVEVATEKFNALSGIIVGQGVALWDIAQR